MLLKSSNLRMQKGHFGTRIKSILGPLPGEWDSADRLQGPKTGISHLLTDEAGVVGPLNYTVFQCRS